MINGIKWSSSKIIIGILLLFIHISTISLLLLFGSRASLNFEDIISSVLILTPLTVSYVTAFLKDIMKNQFVGDASDSAPVFVKFSAFVVQLIFILIFGSALLYSVLAYLFVDSWDTNQFKVLIGVIESAFGVFVGIIVTANYGKSD